MHRKVGIGVLAAGIALVFASSAAAASFDAHGSVEQVYATGLPAGASTSLLDSSDQVVATRNANDLGGILAPNGDQPIWSFAEADPTGQANVAIGYGADMPSRLELPVVPGVTTTTGLPPCPGLRGEPCRDYQPFQNAAASLTDAGGGAAPDTSTQPPASGVAGQSGAKYAVSSKKHKKKHGCRKKKRHHKK
jgi:hypothetical protein